jgi:hypothetical protein
MKQSKWSALAAGAALALAACAWAADDGAALTRRSETIRVTFDARQPGLTALNVDSLGRGTFGKNPIVEQPAPETAYTVTQSGGWVRYSLAGHALWEMRAEGDTLRLKSVYGPGAAAMTWRFNPDLTHATLLGHVTAAGDIALPAVLHLPGMGSLRVLVATGAKTGDDVALGYVAHRNPSRYVDVTFPAATRAEGWVEYTLRTAAIYPAVPGVNLMDRRYDGFRRGYLDIFQQQAEQHVLANNAASDAVAFTVFLYADMARYTPRLAPGLTAMDLVRETLDRYLDGFLGYGMTGYRMFDSRSEREDYPHPSLDTYPSLLIAAYDYVDATGDRQWLRANYKGLRAWAELMTAPNADGSPLLEFSESGNSGSWTPKVTVRPANWWDTIGFGHQDAYSNALGYRALRGMAALAAEAGKPDDAEKYRARGAALKAAYGPAFIDPATGVVAGWRSRDGELHNYFFPFVSGIAVRYGLIEGAAAKRAMDGIVAEMQKVGYTDFSLGLPGNLIPVRRADYVDLNPHAGGPKLEDGSDSFQIYENGGATACWAYFTIAALDKVGERAEADRMLMPMMEGLAEQGFSQRAANGQTTDWRDWKGGAHGYEGLLVDNYYTYMAVLDRAHMLAKLP